MNPLTRKACLALTLFFLNSATVLANESGDSGNPPSAKINGELIIGAESDSNVAVDEIDNGAAVRDSRWSFSADLNYRRKLSPPTELKVSVSHSQDRYDEFSEFDLMTNFVAADLSHEFGKVRAGTTLRYITADLDSQSFLSLSQASFYASALLTDKVFLREDYVYSDKEFDIFTDRNATQHAIGTDLYFFGDGSKRYLVASYKYVDEDAASVQFDRQVHNFKLRYKHTFSIFEREIIGRLKASYRLRDYNAITPSIGVIRDDKRIRLGAELKFSLSRSLFAVLEYEHSDYISNLPAADYKQNLVALKIGWQFGR